MPIDVPAPQKVLTTKYDNFKGVDFTSDPTNVWRHRSPSGVNMLPDASGRPFKRYGWEEVFTQKQLRTIYDKENADIDTEIEYGEAQTGEYTVSVDAQLVLETFEEGSYEFIWSAKYGVVTEDEVEASEDAFGGYFNWNEGYYTFTLGDGWSYEFEPTGEAVASSGEIDISEIGVALLRDFEVGESFMVEITVDWDNASWEHDRQPSDLSLYGLSLSEGAEPVEDDTITLTISNRIEGVTVSRCCWFELSGYPHIVIFTDVMAVFVYVKDAQYTISEVAYDKDLLNSYDRAFFFEGDGKSAFYIYGNNKAWEYLDDLHLYPATPFVPNIMSGADATSTGTIIQGYNLLGSLAWIGYGSNSCQTTWGSEGLVYSVDFSTVASGITNYEYSSGAWTPSLVGITVTSGEEEGARITVVKGNYIVLPNNISQNQVGDIEIYTTSVTQFDTKCTISTSGSPSGNEVIFFDDSNLNEHAMLQFATTMETDSGEDIIKVVFPSRSVEYTYYDDEHLSSVEETGTATLVIGGGE